MPIRIDLKEAGYEGVWVEFRDGPYPFKDRRSILASVSDVTSLNIISQYIVAWNIRDVAGKLVEFDPKKGIENFDELDDGIVITWLIRSWFDARNQRTKLPNAS